MPTTTPYPTFELSFGKDGRPLDPRQLQVLLAGLNAHGITDLFVVSHGWNNDMDDARALYEELFTNVRAQEPSVPGVAGRRFAVAAVLWPSKKFAERDLIPGGAAATDDAQADAVLHEQLDALETLVEPGERAALERARAAIPTLADSPRARRAFAADLLGLIAPAADEPGEPSSYARASPDGDGGETLLDVLGRPEPVAPPNLGGGSAAIGDGEAPPTDAGGGAAGIGDLFNGVKAGAMHLLNSATYYKMKDRAGVVGRRGVNAAVRAVRERAVGVRVHLVGHSFGGRVVTAAVAGGEGAPAADVHSLTLLQAAFSHFGFAENFAGGSGGGQKDGLFRPILTGRHVAGPVVITHTRNDRAVGVAYAIASRIARQVAAGVGDAGDVYGGLGGNGAQKTPEMEAAALRAPGDAYPPFRAGRVYNLKADPFIADHSDVRGAAVAFALLSAVAAT